MRARRIDSSQNAIVAALRKAGCKVWVIGWPCDLLVQTPVRSIAEWTVNGPLDPRTHAPLFIQRRSMHTMECKTPYGKKAPKARVDKRQAAQLAFLAETDTHIATTPQEALRALHLIEFNLESG